MSKFTLGRDFLDHQRSLFLVYFPPDLSPDRIPGREHSRLMSEVAASEQKFAQVR